MGITIQLEMSSEDNISRGMVRDRANSPRAIERGGDNSHRGVIRKRITVPGKSSQTGIKVQGNKKERE